MFIVFTKTMGYIGDIFLYIYFDSDCGLLISFMTWIRPVIPSKEKSLCYFEIYTSISIFDLLFLFRLYVLKIYFIYIYMCSNYRLSFCLYAPLSVFAQPSDFVFSVGRSKGDSGLITRAHLSVYLAVSDLLTKCRFLSSRHKTWVVNCTRDQCMSEHRSVQIRFHEPYLLLVMLLDSVLFSAAYVFDLLMSLSFVFRCIDRLK